MTKYNPKKIESRWQKYWQTHKTFISKDNSKKVKKYVLTEFPYPSGAGLHMGHVRGYTAGDVTSRYLRMRGFEVMYPMGWDAFGLPAENYAIKTGVHPSITTAQNIKIFRMQMDALGFSFDWSREVNTTDPKYYKWTQWLFLQFYKAGLAYEATGLINWCPKDKTGLANEEVIDGKCDRCGTPVQKKELRQWYLKITDYAEKLLKGLEELPQWPEQVKSQQANWIGKSVGAEIEFKVTSTLVNSVSVFTTRPDTIFGATFLVISPEVAQKWIDAGWKANNEVIKYIKEALKKSEQDRSTDKKDKTGVASGLQAENPANKKQIPIFVADYVMGNYGTGAIMAVPAHDERDFDFAKKFKLPIVQVVATSAKVNTELTEAMPGDGVLINSGKFDDTKTENAKTAMAKEFGKPKVQYKLRDWVFSRQRYWGEPIPLIHCPDCGVVPVPEKDLPVLLPKVKKYEPTGNAESPLAEIKSWVNVKCPKCKGPAKRETNTMPQWAGSSWYYLRYTDPKNAKAFAGKDQLKYWNPVDIYFGGMEHTTLHLLYSRFWNLFFFDQKLVPNKEAYTKRVPHGIILAGDNEKMSKSRGNVVNPDDIIKQFGTDTLRMYEMFLGPHDAQVSWNEKGIIGVRRFLDRVWILGNGTLNKQTSEKAERALNKLIKKISEDIEATRFNTAISSFMEFFNEIKDEAISKNSFIDFLKLLYPFAPHISEELYSLLGGKQSLQLQTWPNFDKNKIIDQTVSIMIQVSGKVRGKIEVPFDSSESDVKKLALTQEKVKDLVGKALPKKIIFVPNKIINFVL